MAYSVDGRQISVVGSTCTIPIMYYVVNCCIKWYCRYISNGLPGNDMCIIEILAQ